MSKDDEFLVARQRLEKNRWRQSNFVFFDFLARLRLLAARADEAWIFEALLLLLATETQDAGPVESDSRLDCAGAPIQAESGNNSMPSNVASKKQTAAMNGVPEPANGYDALDPCLDCFPTLIWTISDTAPMTPKSLATSTSRPKKGRKIKNAFFLLIFRFSLAGAGDAVASVKCALQDSRVRGGAHDGVVFQPLCLGYDNAGGDDRVNDINLDEVEVITTIAMQPYTSVVAAPRPLCSSPAGEQYLADTF